MARIITLVKVLSKTKNWNLVLNLLHLLGYFDQVRSGRMDGSVKACPNGRPQTNECPPTTTSCLGIVILVHLEH